ncbi:hypothetical protein DSO57_1015229 [Entomophthora muscae]|uniref:Uncharacterized protein n=1 Tax=Entomophthora muscae TaxID=34485 RepID=A0ACC2TSV6_9FUNG|nr:hypothetical protein DSO57_1015229 [Entomophthora muscae]
MALFPYIHAPTIKHHDIISSTSSHTNTNHSRFPSTAAVETLTLTDPFAAVYAEGDCKGEKINILHARYVVKAPLRSSEVVFCNASNCTVASSHPVPFDIEFSKTPVEAQLPILRIMKTVIDIQAPVPFPKDIKTPFSGPDCGFQIFYPIHFEIRGEYMWCMRAGISLQRTLRFTLAVPSVTINKTSNGFFEYQTICTSLPNQGAIQNSETDNRLLGEFYLTFCRSQSSNST